MDEVGIFRKPKLQFPSLFPEIVGMKALALLEVYLE